MCLHAVSRDCFVSVCVSVLFCFVSTIIDQIKFQFAHVASIRQTNHPWGPSGVGIVNELQHPPNDTLAAPAEGQMEAQIKKTKQFIYIAPDKLITLSLSIDRRRVK